MYETAGSYSISVRAYFPRVSCCKYCASEASCHGYQGAGLRHFSVQVWCVYAPLICISLKPFERYIGWCWCRFWRSGKSEGFSVVV